MWDKLNAHHALKRLLCQFLSRNSRLATHPMNMFARRENRREKNREQHQHKRLNVWTLHLNHFAINCMASHCIALANIIQIQMVPLKLNAFQFEFGCRFRTFLFPLQIKRRPAHIFKLNMKNKNKRIIFEVQHSETILL